MKYLTILFVFMLSFEVFAQLENPESVVWNEMTETYLVSDAGAGKIWSMTKSGAIEEFTTGLTQPKGLAVSTISAFVTDVSNIVEIDLLTGDIVETYEIPGAMFLNDIVSDGFGYLYISDMQANKIYRFDELTGTSRAFSKGNLPAPNGMIYDILGGLIVVSFAQNANIFTIDTEEGNVNLLMNSGLGQLDGIVYDSKRNVYYVSSWATNSVYSVDAAFMDTPELILENLNGPADMFYDEKDDILVIPVMNTGEVVFHEFNSTTVNEFVNDDLQFYPNPVINKLQFRADIQIDEIIISDLLGNKLIKQKTPNHHILLDSLSSGMYIIHARMGNRIITEKIIKR